MAIFGWDSIKQAELYTRAAEQKRMAADAMHLIDVRDVNREQSGVPPRPSVGLF
jgi:hypothetical protein